MSAYGRKHEHREPVNSHATPTARAASLGGFLLVVVIILTAVGLAMAGGLGLLITAWERIR
jgi:hypothetical protein